MLHMLVCFFVFLCSLGLFVASVLALGALGSYDVSSAYIVALAVASITVACLSGYAFRQKH